MGQSAISDDYFRIPYGATKVRIKAGSYNTKVFFYDSSRQYNGSVTGTTTEQEYDIPSGSVYILPSLDNCTPEQMLADNYQITFLNYLGSYSDLSSLATALGGANMLVPYSVYIGTTVVTTIEQLNGISGNTVVSQEGNVTGHGTYSVVLCRDIKGVWPIRFQIEFVNSVNAIWIRMKWYNNEWGAWSKITS